MVAKGRASDERSRHQEDSTDGGQEEGDAGGGDGSGVGRQHPLRQAEQAQLLRSAQQLQLLQLRVSKAMSYFAAAVCSLCAHSIGNTT